MPWLPGLNRGHASIALAGTVAVLVLAGPAGAALPRGGADFGGGSTKFARAYLAPESVSIHTAQSGRTLRYLAHMGPIDCGGTTRIASKGILVSADGQFSDSGPIRNLNTGKKIGTYEIHGTFTDPLHARGTLRATQEQSQDGQTQTCHTTVVKWRAVSPQAGVGSGELEGGRSYYGHNSQRSDLGGVKLPFLLKAKPDAKSLAVLATETENTCPGHPEFDRVVSGGFVVGEVPIKDGAFHGGGPLNETKRVNGHRYRIQTKVSFSGRFGRHRVTGTWRTDVDVYRKSNGAHVASCPGSKLSWAAAK
jgi:hypothetical protein